ncbi:hypothetical protein HYH03_012831 [Edaphochlamys debaryana]|uniref:BTB domain-containing protein n=1 Tax=Edaphochlamys debaryana TaxID=47281 RepID=A0A835XS48_9CHLO|nr:hypothetical protein HYH03_012831 [Edaphochlamys debaryana]|eukprot:KAG2488670.1 hypothetical protein HYH03_012831 [Edaphochlamys debaryana]
MDTDSYLTASIKPVVSWHGRDSIEGVVERPLPDGSDYELLIALDCDGEYELAVVRKYGKAFVCNGETLAIFKEEAPAPGSGSRRKRYDLPGKPRAPIFDRYSNCVFLAVETHTGSAIMRLAEDNTLTVLAGSLLRTGKADGPGSLAIFEGIRHLASDHAGCLYAASFSSIRRIALPESLRAKAPPHRADTGAGASCSGAAAPPPASGRGGRATAGGGREDGRGSGRFAARLTYEAVVSTLGLDDDGAGHHISGLAFVTGRPRPGPSAGPGPSPNSRDTRAPGARGDLLFAYPGCIYRITIDSGPAGSVGWPVLLAGDHDAVGQADGVGGAAQFEKVSGSVAEAGGGVIAVDSYALRRVELDGTVSSVVQRLWDSKYCLPTILPEGQLALCNSREAKIRLLDLGLSPVPLRPPAPAPTGPEPGSLAADLSALLESGPVEGETPTSDLKLRVGGRVFPVHRAILSARCPYFRRRPGGGFSDASAEELDLPDADAMQALLRWMYSGCLPPELPASLLQPLAELSDRLGLMQLCRAAQVRILEAVCPQSVVEALLWAEQRGDAFTELLSGLKDWYLEHTAEVMETALESLRRLASESPGLSVELQVAGFKRARTK